MASYHISVRSSADSTREFRVLLLDDCERAVGELGALTPDHARRIAADLMALVRHRDPKGAFVLDTHVNAREAA